jgi:putative tryptophan/tyrosine transport system substrate-binding protein
MRSWSRRRVVQGAGAVGLGLLVGYGLVAREPAPPKIARIGWLGSASRDVTAPPEPGTSEVVDGFMSELRDLGYEEGRTHTFLWRQTNRGDAGIREYAAELIQAPADVIVVSAGSGPLAKDATRSIPIVLAGGGDPVAQGLVASYARPGGNVTGISAGPGTQFMGKLLEQLRDISPALSRVGVLHDANLPSPSVLHEGSSTRLAHALGLDVYPLGVPSGAALDEVLDAGVRAGVDSLLVIQTPLFGVLTQPIATKAVLHGLPSMGLFRNYAVDGGLLANGPSLQGIGHRAAYYVDRILKGTKPADLPIEQPMRFDLVVNLKTAQALGLTIPHHVLLQATEVIQ